MGCGTSSGCASTTRVIDPAIPFCKENSNVSRYWIGISSDHDIDSMKSTVSASGDTADHNRSMLELRALLDFPIGQQFLLEKCWKEEPVVMSCFTGWMDIQSFSVMVECSKKVTMARSIHKKYIIDSPVLDKYVQSRISESIIMAGQNAIDSQIFNVAKAIFFQNVHDSLFLKFRHTDNYVNLCTKLRRKYNCVAQEDFSYCQLIGQGGFGLVAEVVKKSTGVRYAMKLQRKDHTAKIFDGQMWRVNMEKRAFASCHHPFIVELHFAFQTKLLLAMVITLGTGRDFSKLLKADGPFTIEQVRFYAAEIISALSYLHLKGFVYRDLKPGNVLLNMDGHIKLVDFGGVVDVKGNLIDTSAKAEGQSFPLTQHWSDRSVLIGRTGNGTEVGSYVGKGEEDHSAELVTDELDGCDEMVAGPDMEFLRSMRCVDRAAMKRLRRRFFELDEATILGHYLICGGKVEKAIDHIEKYMLWRQDTFRRADIPHNPTTGTGCFMYANGFDNMGHPLIVFTSRLLDKKTRDVSESLRWIIHIFEEAIQRLPPHLEQITILSNRTGAGNADLDLAVAAFSMIERCYPHRIYKVLLHPVPLSTRAVGAVLLSIAGKQCRSIHLLSSLDLLREEIPDKYIPAELGGSCAYEFDGTEYPAARVCQPYKYCTEHFPDVIPSPGGLAEGIDSSGDNFESPGEPSLRANSIVGTYCYMAPEMVLLMVEAPEFVHTGYTKAVDWWSLGVTIYRLLTGDYPFNTEIPDPVTPEATLTEGSDRYRILMQKVDYQKLTSNPDLVDLISQLLTVGESERLGYGPNGSYEVSAHPFFKEINWKELEQKHSVPPPLPFGCRPHTNNRKYCDGTLDNLLHLYKRPEWTTGGSYPQNEEENRMENSLNDQLANWEYTSPDAVLAELNLATMTGESDQHIIRK